MHSPGAGVNDNSDATTIVKGESIIPAAAEDKLDKEIVHFFKKSLLHLKLQKFAKKYQMLKHTKPSKHNNGV